MAGCDADGRLPTRRAGRGSRSRAAPTRPPAARPRRPAPSRSCSRSSRCVVARGVPVAAAPLVLVRAQEHRPDHARPARRSTRPIRSTFDVPGRGAADPAASRSTGRRASSRCSSRVASRAHSSTRPNPDAAPIDVGGLVADARARLDVRPALGELRQGLGPDRLSAAAVQHDRRSRSSGRSGRCSRARSWPTGSRGSSSPAGTCCSRC